MRRSRWRSAGPAVLALAAFTGCALTGCSATGSAKPVAASSTTQSPMPAATGRKCGTGTTAADVRLLVDAGETKSPVLVEVGQGPVGCHTAMTIEWAYAAALASGRAPGNGGGGPVSIKGWVCEGFDTPQILRTGDASKCSKGPSEILAVLAMPSGSASPSPSA